MTLARRGLCLLNTLVYPLSPPRTVQQIKLNLMGKAMPQQQSLGQREKVRSAMCLNQINVEMKSWMEWRYHRADCMNAHKFL